MVHQCEKVYYGTIKMIIMKTVATWNTFMIGCKGKMQKIKSATTEHAESPE